tara:strand:+ start:799 stop:1242 length:444 start_codon:yes stop_codon:yes gene_type:complete
MAIINKKVKPLKNDRDENIFIGIDLPFRKSEGGDGWFASTSQTFAAVKNNIKALLMTTKGERLMQPNLGMNLKKYLFEPLNDDLIIEIENDIVQTFQFWLPFVNILDLDIRSNENDGYGGHTISVTLKFSIKQNQNFFDTVNVTIGE